MLFVPTQPFTPRTYDGCDGDYDDYDVVTYGDTLWTPLDALRKAWQCVREPLATVWAVLVSTPSPPLMYVSY